MMKNGDEPKFDEFLNHIGLRRDTKLTLEEVKVVKIYPSSQAEKDDVVFQFFTQLQAEDRQVIQKLHSSVTSQQTNKGRLSHISKRDVLFALFNCFDPLLMQYVLHKLQLMGNAVPILMPSVDNAEVYFLQWELQPCFQQHADLDSQPTLTTNDFISVSAFRFGDLDFSKSDVLNKLLAKLQNNDGSACYISYSEDQEQTVWSKGTVEVTWYTSKEELNISNSPPFFLLNLRGDGHQHVRQQNFCRRVSQIQIVFFSQYCDENLKHIYAMTETSHVIVVTNKTAHEEIKAFQTDKLSVVHCKGLLSQEISEMLLKSLVEKIRTTNRHFKSSVEDLTDVSVKLNFIDNEHTFQRAKRLAEEIVDDIPYEIQDYKQQMLQFTKSYSDFGNVGDLVENSFPRDKLDQCSDGLQLKHIEKLQHCFTFDKYEQQIFLTYLFLCLQKKLCRRLQSSTNMYMSLYDTVKHLSVFGMETDRIKEMECNVETYSLEKTCVRELNDNNLKVEHFLWALWHRRRSAHSKTDSCFSSSFYNEFIKTWLMSGNSIDLVSIDTSHKPSSWALELLNTLQSLRKDHARVRVVSAFGGYGAQSCILLNHLFGSSFTKTENVCSGGLRMQLIPVHNTSELLVTFDYLLLLDINALSLAEVTQGSYSEMREYLLILMSSITDVLIIDLNKDRLRGEESIMFDMIVHTVLEFKSSVVNKCCVIYHATNSKCPSLSDLQSRTQSILENSCGKVHERKGNSWLQTYFQRTNLHKKVLSCFSNEGTINVKILPNIQNLSSNQDYVKSITEIKKHILLLLKECQRKACSLRDMSETIFRRTRNASNKENTSPTPFHKFVYPSYKIHQYYINNIEEIQQTISYTIVTASTNIATADNKQDACIRLDTDISELLNYEVKKVRQFLTIAGRMNTILSETCNALIAKLLKYKEKQLHYSSKEMQKAVKVATENNANDAVIRRKTRELLATMKRLQEDESESLSAGRHLEDGIKECIGNMREEYPQTPFLELKSRIELRITDELKKTKYGSHVHTFIDTKVIDDWCDHSIFINSMDDLRRLEKRFNVEDKIIANGFLECHGRLMELSTDYANFTTNSEKVITLLKQYLQPLQNTMNSLTMFIFLCIKFISSIHRHHVRADMKSKHSFADKMDFENYIVKQVEPLRFPSLKSKLAYIVPLFATLLSGDDLSDLAKSLRSRSVLNYDHIPLHLLTIQRLDRHFLLLLPVTSSQNFNNILDVVNNAKLYCLGKALANFVDDFGELFDNIFDMIKHSLINGRDSEVIKAAAFVHVSAWSSPLIAVKEYEKDSITNAANRALKLVPILKLNILFAKQPLDKEFAQIVGDAIEDALLTCIPQEIQRKLRKFLLQRSHVLFLKRSLIGRMLRSFCNEGDFKQFVSFVEDYDHCSRKYILLFLVTQINDGSKSLIWKLKDDVIEENITSATQVVTQTTSHCVEIGDYSLYAWIQTFKQHFVGLNDKRFEYLEKHVNFSDVNVFAEHCCSILSKLKHKLSDRIELPEKGNVDSTKTFLFSLSRNMHEEFSGYIIGCTEQCPLCGNVCEFDLVNHEYHSVLAHIPIGIKGGRDRESDNLIPLTCPSLVSNNNIFTPLDLEDEEISKLSTFMKDMHPTWHVQDAENDPHVFWKYILNRFNRQFAEFYECREGKLPPEWKEYTKEDAIRSVERTYKLDQNEFLSH